jgi:hypothetical protein
LLAAVTSGPSVARDTGLVRERFEEELRVLVRARSIVLCDDPTVPAAPQVMCFDVPAPAPHHRARIEAIFEPARLLDGWTCQLLDTATHVAALILEIERLNGRGLPGRGRPDGAAPLIGSSQAIRAVRDRIERVAATDSPSSSKEGSVHSRTAVSLRFELRLPSNGATGRWREREMLRRR